MNKKSRNKKISILWEDAKLGVFKKENRILLTPTKCEGELVKQDKKFIILRNCKQFIFDKKKENLFLNGELISFLSPRG